MPERAVILASILREGLWVVLGGFAALFVVDPLLVRAWIVLSLLDTLTLSWEDGKHVPRKTLPGRFLAGPAARFGQAVVGIIVILAIGNPWPVFERAIPVVLGYFTIRAGVAAATHVFPPTNGMRRFLEGSLSVMVDVLERLPNAVVDRVLPPEDPAPTHGGLPPADHPTPEPPEGAAPR
jgi:hypothetical protein